ncbi:MAG: DUF2064 domain-containing protein [Calditrichia bacterium]
MAASFPNSRKRAVILFANHPTTDAARKKLSKNVRQSEKILRAMQHHVFTVLGKAKEEFDFQLIIATDQMSTHLQPAGADESAVKLVRQCGKDFGERIGGVLHNVFEDGYSKVVIVGNDCIDLSAEVIRESFRLLEDRDVVLGPAEDGGVYLMGFSGFDEPLFRDVPWCSGKVFSRLLENSRSSGKRTAMLELLPDIDSEKQLLRWCNESIQKRIPVLRIILEVIHLRKFTAGHQIPFIVKNHRRKELWQKSPPPCLSVAT